MGIIITIPNDPKLLIVHAADGSSPGREQD